MTREQQIRRDYRQSGAFRILRLLGNCPAFSDEVQQLICREGMRLVETPEFEAQS